MRSRHKCLKGPPPFVTIAGAPNGAPIYLTRKFVVYPLLLGALYTGSRARSEFALRTGEFVPCEEPGATADGFVLLVALDMCKTELSY